MFKKFVQKKFVLIFRPLKFISELECWRTARSTKSFQVKQGVCLITSDKNTQELKGGVPKMNLLQGSLGNSVLVVLLVELYCNPKSHVMCSLWMSEVTLIF